ncbi:MAG TPA: ABC transporter permease [Candidatus Tectomicrobia bacterium]|nr:ABC transporter permease [Candidatus Tectomicrobia bacterium]
MKSFFRTDAQPSVAARCLLSILFFALLIAGYLAGSYYRHRENPQDTVMPTLSQMLDGMKRSAFEQDRNGELRLWVDTLASARRFGIALGVVFLAIPLGVGMGLFPYVEALFYRFLVFFDKIPALSVLPILFIVFGLGELSKIALIVLGVFPTVALDAHLRAKAIPREQIDKAHTLGASEHEIAYRIVLPQILPRMLDTIRLNLKATMLLLIAGESLAATVGLGYRIFVVRRYVAMDIIIPYVLWMTGLLFLTDWFIQWVIRKQYVWLDK